MEGSRYWLIPTLCAGVLLAGTACSGSWPRRADEPVHSGQAHSYPLGTKHELAVGESVSFDDGLSVLLKRIDSPTCNREAGCSGVADSTATFEVHGGGFGNESEQIILSVERLNRASVSGYTFELHDAANQLAVLAVRKAVK